MAMCKYCGYDRVATDRYCESGHEPPCTYDPVPRNGLRDRDELEANTGRWSIVSISRDGTTIWVEPFVDEDSALDPDGSEDRCPLFSSAAAAKAGIARRMRYEVRELPRRDPLSVIIVGGEHNSTRTYDPGLK